MNHRLGGRRKNLLGTNNTNGEGEEPTTEHNDAGQRGAPEVRKRWYESSDFWTAFGTLVIAAFTIGLTLVSCKQTAILGIADETARSNERAYVMPKNLEVWTYGERSVNGQVVWKITPSWENSGTTPAGSVILYTTWSWSLVNPQSNNVAAASLGRWDFNSVVPVKIFIGPKQEKRGTTINFEGSEMSRITSGKDKLAIIGFAAYQDIFRNRHITLSCRWVSELPHIDFLDPDQKGPFTGVESDCPAFNCTDEDCRQYAGEFWWPKDVKL